MDLEQQCVRPGKWLIEGWVVIRHAPPHQRMYWHAQAFGIAFTKSTLAAIRDEIANRIVQARPDDHQS